MVLVITSVIIPQVEVVVPVVLEALDPILDLVVLEEMVIPIQISQHLMLHLL